MYNNTPDYTYISRRIYDFTAQLFISMCSTVRTSLTSTLTVYYIYSIRYRTYFNMVLAYFCTICTSCISTPRLNNLHTNIRYADLMET